MSAAGARVGTAPASSGHSSADWQAFHPLLRRLFEAFERTGIRWLLLRVPSVPSGPTGDVDLLVAPQDADELRAVATSLGFAVLPGWEAPPNLILVGYDRESDQWLVLDVSTSVSFRSARWTLDPALTQAVLDRRRTSDGISLPAHEDAFWLLLLHCLLDKRNVAPHYRSALRELAPTTPRSPLGGAACAAAGGRLNAGALVALVRGKRWEAVVDEGSELIAGMRRRTPLARRLRLVMSDIMVHARKPLLVPRRWGPSIALLGPNGVGKSTAAAGLQASIPFESRILYMGIWKTPSRDGHARAIWRVATRPLRIWWRYLLAQYHQLHGRTVIFDRYVYEALLPPRPPLIPLKRAYFWLLVHLVPRPTAVVVLDVAGHIAYGRKQENPPAELEFERRHYAELAARLSSADVVDAGADADDVRAKITAILWRELRSRWSGAPWHSR